MAPDVRVYDLAQRLLECANDRLAETDGGAIDEGNACVITGAIAWDNCLCGSLNVAITSGFPSSNFPTPSANTAAQFGAGRCGQPILVFNLTITVLRCVPVSDEQGNPPPCEALSVMLWASDKRFVMVPNVGSAKLWPTARGANES